MQRSIEVERFKKAHGYDLNLDEPKTYNEKICHSKLFNRNPLLTLTTDKYRARQYIREKVGEDCEEHFVPLYFVFDSASFVPYITFPSKYVIKPNHSSGKLIIKDDDYTVGMGKAKYQASNLSALELIVEAWLKEDYSIAWNEWAYKDIEPLIVIEELITDSNGNLPTDYRLSMFDGKLGLVSVTTPYQETFNYFDKDLKPVSINVKPELKDFKLPKLFDKALELAEKISKGWNFIRCDFFITDKVYFSELTHYPGAGNSHYPYDFDLQLGELWRNNGSRRTDTSNTSRD